MLLRKNIKKLIREIGEVISREGGKVVKRE
jgi:hypothetical protein